MQPSGPARRGGAAGRRGPDGSSEVQPLPRSPHPVWPSASLSFASPPEAPTSPPHSRAVWGRGSRPPASPRGAGRENWGELGLQKSASQARSSPGEPPASRAQRTNQNQRPGLGGSRLQLRRQAQGQQGSQSTRTPAVSAPPQCLHRQNLRVRKEGPELRASLAVRPAGAPAGPQGAGAAPRSPRFLLLLGSSLRREGQKRVDFSSAAGSLPRQTVSSGSTVTALVRSRCIRERTRQME